jgi:predicted protein tyrosine phosphatase
MTQGINVVDKVEHGDQWKGVLTDVLVRIIGIQEVNVAFVAMRKVPGLLNRHPIAEKMRCFDQWRDVCVFQATLNESSNVPLVNDGVQWRDVLTNAHQSFNGTLSETDVFADAKFLRCGMHDNLDVFLVALKAMCGARSAIDVSVNQTTESVMILEVTNATLRRNGAQWKVTTDAVLS